MKVLVSFALLAVFFGSCAKAVKQEDLYGRWNYVKVENSNPQDSLPDGELELQSPAIIFTEENDLEIEWGSKKLSSGKFRLEGKMIRYTENLENGQKREFPFLINKLNKTELIFQTMEQSVTTVTATKESD